MLEFDQVSLIATAAVAAMRGMSYNDLVQAVRGVMGTAKNSHTFVEKFPTTGGTFSISPGNFQNHIHITVSTQSHGAQGAVLTGYDETTQTITIGGY